jgi:type III secretory pathway lipoprotein EscJ
MKVGKRIQEMVHFSVRLDSQDPDLNIDKQSKDLLKESMDSYDYESIKVTREHKVEQLKKIIKDAVDFKYRISLGKGMRMVQEVFIMVGIMIALIAKANVFSLIYLTFVIRYMYNPKTDILFKISIYMSFFLAVQYIL